LDTPYIHKDTYKIFPRKDEGKKVRQYCEDLYDLILDMHQ